jgi:hypothetical protein
VRLYDGVLGGGPQCKWFEEPSKRKGTNNMKRLKALIKTLIRYEKKAEEITGKDLDKLVVDLVKKELKDES